MLDLNGPREKDNFPWERDNFLFLFSLLKQEDSLLETVSCFFEKLKHFVLFGKWEKKDFFLFLPF